MAIGKKEKKKRQRRRNRGATGGPKSAQLGWTRDNRSKTKSWWSSRL